jgi:hypothetical protein
MTTDDLEARLRHIEAALARLDPTFIRPLWLRDAGFLPEYLSRTSEPTKSSPTSDT